MNKTPHKFGLKRLTFLTLCCGLSAMSLSDASPDQSLTALRCGKLLDVEHKNVLRNVTILVAGERIVEIIEQSKQASIPSHSKVIDLRDHTCLPGLMDMHYHPMAHNGVESMYNKSRSSAEYALTGASNVAKMLRRGFTTLRVPGHPPDPGYALVDLRDAINKGLLEGPRLFVAPHGLGRKRSEAEVIARVKETKLGKEVQESLIKMSQVHNAIQQNKVESGLEGVRAAVQRQIANGADWIKIHLDEGGMLGSPVTPNTFSDKEVKVFVEETHRHGKRIVVGSHGDKASLTATLAGADSIEHGLYISEKTAEIMKAKGTYLVPTLAIFNDNIHILEHDHPQTLDNWSKSMWSVFQQLTSAQQQALREEDRLRDKSFQYAYKIGVKIANGSDQSSAESALREFTYLVDQGVSTWDAIIMGTLNGADLLGMKDQIGSIGVGKYADIIAVPDNPLDRIEALQQISFVMKNGELIFFRSILSGS